MRVAIESLEAGDGSLAAFLDQAWPKGWRVEGDFPAWCVVRGVDGVLAAGAVSMMADGTAWLDRGFVRPDYRGRGLHYVVTRGRCAYAIVCGANAIETSIRPSNWPSIATYRRLGFERVWQLEPTDYIPFRKAVRR